MKVVLALLCAVAGVAVNAGVVEERLSRFLSAVNVADGTNVVVVLQKWGDVFLVRQDGDSSYVPVEQGARILIPCGRNISVTQTALTTAMQIQVRPGVRIGCIDADDRDTSGEITIRICEEDRMDIRIFPNRRKTAYDAMSGRYVDMAFPFRSMWRDKSDMLDYLDRRRHLDFAERILQRSAEILAFAKECMAANPPVPAGPGADSIIDLPMPVGLSDGRLCARLSANGKMKTLRMQSQSGKAKIFVYTDDEDLCWYSENGGLHKDKVSTLLQFDQDGSLKASWQSNYEPQYMVVSNGVESFSMKVGEVQEYFKSAAEAFRVERGNKKKGNTGSDLTDTVNHHSSGSL